MRNGERDAAVRAPGAATRAQAGVWTETEIRQLVDGWRKDVSLQDIAVDLGRSKKSVAVKACRLGLTKRGYFGAAHLRRAKRIGMARPCLSCEGLFFSEGPGNRICPKCIKSEEWSTGGDHASAAP